MFVNGDLKGKFIMDRNLGARDTKFASEGKGAFHYQFGRPSPFPTDGMTSFGTNAYVATGGESEKLSIEYSSGTTTVATAVSTPMIFYQPGAGLNWCEAVDSVTYLWQDYEQDANGGGKSIFDPSPLGWKVPPHGTWSSFTTETMTDYNDGSIDGQYGRSYPRENPFTYFPSYGVRHAESGGLTTYPTNAEYWSSTPSAATSAYLLKFSSTYINPYQTYGRATARPLRPVQHDE